MKGYIVNIEEKTKQNTYFREVLYTSKHSQITVMSIPPKEDIGEEVHELDQFIRVEKGRGVVVLDGEKHELPEDYAVIIPAGVLHNVINESDEDLKLYSIYSPPEHKDKIIHKTKQEALENEQHFDGKTTQKI